MRFGASTFIWTSPFGVERLDLIDHVASLGFGLIEICIDEPEKVETGPIRARLKDAGVKALVCGAFGPQRDMSSDDPEVRDRAARYLTRCVEIASELGSPTVSGPMYAGVGNTLLRSPAERRRQWDRAVTALRPITEKALAQDVKLALEPLNRFETDLINTVEQGLAFLDDLGADNAGLLLDTFHMNIEEKNIPDAIGRAGSKIFEFHACGSDRGTPGEDHLPWPGIAAALASARFEGPIVIEAFTPQIQEIARAVSLWRPLAESQDALASNGLAHLRRIFA